jgi:hypothetical protein
MGEKRARPARDHFSEEDWLDFARAQSGETGTALERHLATGCASCVATLRFWQSVLSLAGREATYTPPDAAVRQARARFAFERPKGLVARAAETAALVFDSFRQPLAAGVRAAGPSPRQMLYKAGSYVVRLRVEPANASERLSIVGQIVDDADPARKLSDLAVLVLSGKETVDRTLTNHLGEFALDPEPADNLRLSVGVPDCSPLTVPLLVRSRASRADARVLGGPGRKTARTRRQSKSTTPSR